MMKKSCYRTLKFPQLTCPYWKGPATKRLDNAWTAAHFPKAAQAMFTARSMKCHGEVLAAFVNGLMWSVGVFSKKINARLFMLWHWTCISLCRHSVNPLLWSPSTWMNSNESSFSFAGIANSCKTTTYDLCDYSLARVGRNTGVGLNIPTPGIYFHTG